MRPESGSVRMIRIVSARLRVLPLRASTPRMSVLVRRAEQAARRLVERGARGGRDLAVRLADGAVEGHVAERAPDDDTRARARSRRGRPSRPARGRAATTSAGPRAAAPCAAGARAAGLGRGRRAGGSGRPRPGGAPGGARRRTRAPSWHAAPRARRVLSLAPAGAVAPVRLGRAGHRRAMVASPAATTDEDGGGPAVSPRGRRWSVVGDPDREPRGPEPPRGRVPARRRPGRLRGHPAHRRLLRHAGASDADGAPSTRTTRPPGRPSWWRGCGPAAPSPWSATRACPGVSDPGARLVRPPSTPASRSSSSRARAPCLRPGGVSGLAGGGRYAFTGFVPRAAGERRACWSGPPGSRCPPSSSRAPTACPRCWPTSPRPRPERSRRVPGADQAPRGGAAGHPGRARRALRRAAEGRGAVVLAPAAVAPAEEGEERLAPRPSP